MKATLDHIRLAREHAQQVYALTNLADSMLYAAALLHVNQSTRPTLEQLDLARDQLIGLHRSITASIEQIDHALRSLA